MGRAIGRSFLVTSALAVLLDLACVRVHASARPQADHPSARWLGQIGRDRVGRSSRVGPNGVQDVVIALSGLPADLAVARIVVRGYGGDEWNYRGAGSHWAADLEREPGSVRALLYLEPNHVESGREFLIEVAFEGGRVGRTKVQGGRADPMVRMPEVQLAARWACSDGSDHVGPGPAVGPDGFTDARIELARLAADPEVLELSVLAEDGSTWSYGPNPEGHRDALLIRSADDRTRGLLYLCPTPGIEGQRIRIDLSYDDGTRDRTVLVAGQSHGDRPVDRPTLPVIEEEEARILWLGQVDEGPLGPGAVRLALDRETDRGIRAAVLTDDAGGFWVFAPGEGVRDEPSPFFGERGRRLHLVEGDRPGSFLIDFEPFRDERDAAMTLRLIDEAGNSSIVEFPGESCDPTRRFATPLDRDVRLDPGDDLPAIAERGGTIRLAPGVYDLSAPLDLMGATTMIAEPGAELRFRQGPGDGPWGEAVAIRGAGLTRISGLRIRFEGPIRWDPRAAWGSAIIGVPNLGERPGGPVHVEARGLDLEAPPASSEWEPAPNCLRFIDTDSGVVEGCTFKGGPIVLFDGPWRVANNRHLGTRPRTFAGSFLSGRLTRDLDIAGNTVRPEPGSGKLYRFLVLADRGLGVTIRDNYIVGVGPMDDDERPHPNAPEVLLTESYRLRFEGRHHGLSDDGRVLAIPDPQGSHPEVCEVVSALSGPDAGRWALVAQVLDRNVLLLDRPLPAGDYDVAIAPGFVRTAIEGNTIDCRGSTEANNIVLTGNHYGTRVTGNTLLGGSNAFRFSSYATNEPFHYAWSHTPQLDLWVESNTVVDSARGGLIAVHHGPRQKSNRGRVYLTGTVLGNTFRWTAGAPAGVEADLVALTIGQLPSIDPGELVLKVGRNEAFDARGRPLREPLRTLAGTINGRSHVTPGD